MPEQLDPAVVNLAKAIRQHETGNRPISGASGELASRYQYMPGTWKSTAGKYLGDANAPLTLQNENKATYLKIKDWKDQGYNVAQIASMWNSGKPEWEGKVGINKAGVKYDVPKYVNSVVNLYNVFKNKIPDFNQRVDAARNNGKTDTQILDELGAAMPAYQKQIEEARKGKTNDKDFLNMLSLRNSGKKPTVQSVPLEGQIPDEQIVAKKGLMERVGEDVEARHQRLSTEGVSVPSKVLRTAGKYIGDVTGTGIEVAKSGLGAVNAGLEGAYKGITGKEYVPSEHVVPGTGGTDISTIPGAKQLGQLITEHPNVEAGLEVASVAPVGKLLGAAAKTTQKVATKVAPKVAPIAQAVVQPIQTAKSIKQAVVPAPTVDSLVGQITQGTKQEVAKAKAALGIVDTSGVRTYSGLKDASTKKISELAAKQDEIMTSQGGDKLIKISNLGKKFSVVGGRALEQNFVKDAINHLVEFYSKTNDPQNLARIVDLRSRSVKQGLSVKEINDIAREYGQNFTRKAFTVTGEPITSVNKVAAENIRKGVKDTARSLLPNDAARILDEQMTNLYTLQRTAERMEKAVQRLQNKVKNRGIFEKIGRGAAQAVNLATGGGAKEFLTTFLPSNVGNKVMNSLDLEAALSKNLKKVDRLIQSGSDKEIIDYLKTITPKGE